MKNSIRRKFTFEAAHQLPNAPDGHKCRNLHGHSYTAWVEVEGLVDSKAGWIVDFGEIDRITAVIRKDLDHTFLNTVPGLENPTAEILAEWVCDRLVAFNLPLGVRVRAVEIREGFGGVARYERELQ